MRSASSGWGRELTAAAAVCLTAGFLVGAVGVRAAEQAASNLDLMTDLTSEVVDELYTKFQGSLDGRPLALKPFGSGEEYVFITNVITSELTERGVTVVEAAAVTDAAAPGATTSESSPGHVLQYQSISFGIGYEDVYRSHLVGGKHVRRRADVRLMMTLTDAANGHVLWVGEAARDRQDEFDHGDATRVEQGSYQFARPVMPASGWGRYAEPVFVTGIIVGLIYLFFSNQSDN